MVVRDLGLLTKPRSQRSGARSASGEGRAGNLTGCPLKCPRLQHRGHGPSAGSSHPKRHEQMRADRCFAAPSPEAMAACRTVVQAHASSTQAPSQPKPTGRPHVAQESPTCPTVWSVRARLEDRSEILTPVNLSQHVPSSTPDAHHQVCVSNSQDAGGLSIIFQQAKHKKRGGRRLVDRHRLRPVCSLSRGLQGPDQALSFKQPAEEANKPCSMLS